MTFRRNSFRRNSFGPRANSSCHLVLCCGALLCLAARNNDAPDTEPTTAPAPQLSAAQSEATTVISRLPDAPGTPAGAASLPAVKATVTADHALTATAPAGTVPTGTPTANRPTPGPPRHPGAAQPGGETMQAAAHRLGLLLPLPAGHIVVKKSERRLEVWSGSTPVKSYRVALGRAPAGHKEQQGDGRTPEGEFFICTRNATNSGFHIFLGLSYPALPDAQRGLQSHVISEREFQAIRVRLASRSVPLWRTRLGGWVGIHGGTGGAFANKQSAARHSPDWTAGCIALTNREIEEIYAATRLGTPVSVRP